MDNRKDTSCIRSALYPGKHGPATVRKAVLLDWLALLSPVYPQGVLWARTLIRSALWRPLLLQSGEKGAKTGNTEGSWDAAGSRNRVNTLTQRHTRARVYVPDPQNSQSCPSQAEQRPKNTTICRDCTVLLPGLWILKLLGITDTNTTPSPFLQQG